MMIKTITITSDNEKISMKTDGFEAFELLGVLYYLEQQLKVKLLQAHDQDD